MMAGERFEISWLNPTEDELREQWRTLIDGPPVMCYFTDYPPLEGERSVAYQRRVMPLLGAAAFPPKVSLWQRVKRLVGCM